MKKNFFKKKLASALALALVVASVSPVSASAATAAKIVDKGASKATAVLYVDKVSYGKSAVNFDLSKTYAGTTYTWTVSDSKKATIGAKTGYVVAKAPGVVKVTVTAKKGKTTTKFTQSVTIKKRATAVAAGDDFKLNTGETKALKATLTPSNSTDAVKYVSDKETVATVDAKTGVVTAVGAGEATITVYAKAASSAPDSSKWNVSDTVKVTVPLGLAKVAQTKGNVLTATFNGSLTDKTFAVSDFKIVNDTTKAEYPVKSVSVDGSVVTVTTYSSMADGKVYNVTYDGKTSQFTATDGVVASLTFSPVTVPYGTATEVDVNTVDAKGVIIASYGVAGVTNSNLEYSITTNQGYVSGSNLVLNAIGNTATATATYHTYKFDSNGNELGVIKATATITAVDVTAVTLSSYKYTVASSTPNWYSFTQNTKIAVGDTAYKFYFTGTKSDNSNISTGDYYFASSNSDVLSVGTATDLSGTIYADIYAISAGSAYVLVKSASTNAVVYSLPVTILAGRTASTIALGSLTATVSNTTQIQDSNTVSVDKKDQYGVTVGSLLSTDITVTSLSAPSGVVVAENTQYVRVADGVKFLGSVGTTPTTAGTYVYKITVGNLPSQTVTVYVNHPSGSTYTYQLIKTADTVDEIFNYSALSDVADKTVTVKIARLLGGVLYDYVNLATINGSTTDADSDNITIYNNTTSTTVTGSAISGTYNEKLTFTVLDVPGLTGGTVTKAAIGSYSVKIDGLNASAATPYATGTKTSLSAGFTVTDSQSVVSYTRSANTFDVSGAITVANQNGLAVEVANGVYTFKYEGSAVSVLSATGKLTGTTLTLQTVTLGATVSVGGQTYTVPITITVNQSIAVY